ncbi:L-serine ammonia-lyase [Nocardia sp. NPDC052278]|uniref:L-serine ammonia-lyase n=1 Tax=unclassified Nocardia TaxID=2637762 RepID=UPI0036A4304E
MSAYISVSELFTIGIGPSSSHTVGPMRAARAFTQDLLDRGVLSQVTKVACTLYGSLAATGVGHGTPDAVVAGLSGLTPEDCDPDRVRGRWSSLRVDSRCLLAGVHEITFTPGDIVFQARTRLPAHPNALALTAWAGDGGRPLAAETYYSIGGGFIRREGEQVSTGGVDQPLPFDTAEQLLDICATEGCSISEVARRNEAAIHGEAGMRESLQRIWAAMVACVSAGLSAEGTLPGGLGTVRRAGELKRALDSASDDHDDCRGDWLLAFALAVNEENAAGGRVVTAPTNGAAGIVPAVAHYYLRFIPGADVDGVEDYLLTATAIGALVKANASISGAEGGCQAEVGAACAMAAAGLCAVLGGSPPQVENAAEIAIEHHLGLTCDPVGGLVQIPCIERNAVASSTAVTAARLALRGTGAHRVSLDTAIETMRQTGLDMSHKYKETSLAGLAVNVVEC